MDLLEKISKAGVVGAGGAGFPTHMKLNCKVEYLIINGLECEPLLKTDQYIMRNKSFEVVTAVEAMAKQVEAKNIVIALKEKYKKEAEMLQNAINSLKSNIRLHLLDSIYPAGDEQILVYEITGRSIPPGGIPLNVNAVVSNIGTAYNIYRAMEDKPVTYKYLSVLGEVKEPKILKVPIGTSIAECINSCGGLKINNCSIIMGGPMMGKKLAADKLYDAVITKTDGAIIAVPENHYIIQRDKRSLKHIINQAKSACIQCRYCTDMCPRYLIGHPLHPHKVMRAIAMSEENEVLNEALICCECGICELYACPMGLSPRKINIYLKEVLRDKGIRYKDDKQEAKALDMRGYRRIPTNRLISRIDLDKYKEQKVGELQELKVSSVRIPLKQHIGAAAMPVVFTGDSVKEGQLIARVENGAMGAVIHASITGTVEKITKDSIIIKATE